MIIPSCVARAVSVGDLAESTPEVRARVQRLREPEVEHLHRAVAADLDVGGLQIAMHDAQVVRGLERFGDLPGDRQRLGDRHRSALDQRRKIVALDQLHHQRADAVRFLEAVDVRDVGVIERCEHLGFAGEAGQALGVLGEVLRQDLDGDVAVEPGVARAVDLPHASLTELGGDLVRTESRAGGQRHRRNVA